METDPQDLQLKRQFTALSEADRQFVPSFDDMLKGETQVFRDRGEGRESWLYPGYTALGLTAVTIAILALLPIIRGGKTSLETVASNPPLEIDYPSFSWESTPTSFLLSSSFSEPVTSIDTSSSSSWDVPTDTLFDYSPDLSEEL